VPKVDFAKEDEVDPRAGASSWWHKRGMAGWDGMGDS